MSIVTNGTLGTYRVVAALGAGGMGEVWRAEDTRLGREVALKVLPEEFAKDPERMARFEREAKVLASLNHPNIATLYGLETVETSGTDTGTGTGTTFLAMELVEGEDLSERIERGPISVDEAIPIASQIAEALEAAHEQGIVHRDLKPANIKLTEDGVVKVLDFGLAKAWESETVDSSLSLSPTMTRHATVEGVILGTAAYMSPEQARGKKVDRRADIWAFGVVLWEMLTGQKLFEGETITDIMAALVRQQIDLDTLPEDTPASVRDLLGRCLDRDPRTRLRDIGEARIALHSFLSDPESAEVPSDEPSIERPTAASRLKVAAVWLLGGAILGGLGAALLGGLGKREIESAGLRYAIHPVQGQIVSAEDTNGLDISRDGRSIVFVGTEEDGSGSVLYVKTAEDAEPRVIAGAEDARAPFFSPDGRWIGFFSDNELRKVSINGGSPIPLAPAGDRRGAVWHPDGTIYFTPSSTTAIMKVSGNGGEVTPVTTLNRDRLERTHRWPSVVPGGKAILFTSDTHQSTEYYDDAQIEAVNIETGERKVVLESSSRAVATANGHLVFARDGALYAVDFDLDRLEVVGSPNLALQGVLTVVASGAVQFALSDTGGLAYVPGGKTTDIFDLVWMTPDGEFEIASPEPGYFTQAAVSPQGDRVVLMSSTRENTDLWILDMASQSVNRLTFEGSNQDPVWTPDGRRIIFASTRGGTTPKPYVKNADGTGEVELLWDSDEDAYPADITRDGRWLAVELNRLQADDGTGSEVWLLDMTGEREPFPFFEDQESCRYSAFSPDGRWLAYVSRETGVDQIYVRPFPSADGKWQVSQVAAREPRWAPDGRRLYYRSIEGFKFVDIDTRQGFRAGRPVLIEPGQIGPPYNMTFSIPFEGDRFLALRAHVEGQAQWRVHVVNDWQHGLAD